ncbi:MAG: DNA repair protein RadC [Acholeplasmataceae bacterium]|jgi:DNA repair protein RadC|nr:DNA repair protein RadC [Acholeplasmataceae bacterium]
MYIVKEMPKEERPRERLMHHGVQALSNDELLAILLRTGRKDLSVIELSKSVLYHLDALSDLKNIKVEELMLVNGIKEAKACTLIAAIELGRRLSQSKQKVKSKIESPSDVYFLLAHELSHLSQEHFICIYLNTKSEVIKSETLFIGTLNQTLIHPREIFRQAVKLSASAIIFVHNHPTGDSNPSKADVLATEQLKEASRVMGIDVVDHIIIGHFEFYSMKEQKKIKIK